MVLSFSSLSISTAKLRATSSRFRTKRPAEEFFSFSPRRLASRRHLARITELIAKKSSSEGPLGGNANPANAIEGIARLVSMSVAANAKSLANQVDKPSWLNRGGPLAAEVYNKISENRMAEAVAQLRDWSITKALSGEVLLALWRLIPADVATIDQTYLEASQQLEGDEASRGAQLAEMARFIPQVSLDTILLPIFRFTPSPLGSTAMQELLLSKPPEYRL